jgi:hypothetical protein
MLVAMALRSESIYDRLAERAAQALRASDPRQTE